MTSTRNFKRGDLVEVDLNSGMGGLPPRWVPAVVTCDTDPTYGWTAAITTSKSPYGVISRGPGWLQDEIRPLEEEGE